MKRKREWWDKLAAGPIAGRPGALARCPRLATALAGELLAVADAMASGDYYRELPPSAAETAVHSDPAFWE